MRRSSIGPSSNAVYRKALAAFLGGPMVHSGEMALFMRVALVGAVVLPFLGVTMSGQQAQSSTPAATPADAGRKLFVQRCSVCHMPPLGPGQPRSYAKSLTGIVKDKQTETAARGIIEKGIPNRMPGFQSGLTSGEIDRIVAYLGTLK